MLWDAVDTGSPEPAPSGTYGFAIGLNIDTLTAQVLYDSSNFIETKLGGPVNPATTSRYALGAWARPEGVKQGPLIHGVEVHLSIGRPAGWAANGLIPIAYRIVVADQDAVLGIAELDVFYDLWRNVAGDATAEPARFANGRQNCAEWRKYYYFNNESVTPMFTVHNYHRFKRRLQAQEGLFLLLQTSSQSNTINQLDMHCRTLVEDDT